MERTRRLTRFWNWLPAFRVVAETEHLPTAAKALNVSASALSRTISLIEDDLGVLLFERVGRRIALSASGREFLGAVRDAMRRVDDGLTSLEGNALHGTLRLSARGTHAWIMVPAIVHIADNHPHLVCNLATLGDAEVTAALRKGSLDLALVDGPLPHPDVSVEHLGSIGYGVFCGPNHSLRKRSSVTVKELQEHSFVAPPEGVNDNWPPQLTRKIGARVDLLHSGLALVEEGQWLGFLPEPITRQPQHANRLFRVAVDVAAPLQLYAVYRRPVGTYRPTEVALEAVRAVASSGAI